MKKRCKHSKLSKDEKRINYQVRCIKKAEKNGYCTEHYIESKKKKSNSSRADNFGWNNKRIKETEQNKFIRKFGKPIIKEVV